MFDFDSWREIFQSINKNRLRSLLSGFTVAFAILLFTLLFGIGNGLENSFKKKFSEDAFNSIFIWTNRTTKPYKGKKIGRKIRLKNEDFKLLKEKFGNQIEMLSPYITKNNVDVVYKNKSYSYSLQGVYPGAQSIESINILKGRFLTLKDVYQKERFVVIGRLVQKDLSEQVSMYGKEISIGGLIYKVIGIFSDSGGDDEERKIYTSYKTMQNIYGNNSYIDYFGMTYNPKMSVDQAIFFGNKIQKLLKNKYDVSPKDQRAIRLHNNAFDNKSVSNMMVGLGILILIIGLGTLIAGVVGISNIMVYVVKERSKELGIRKAIGATPKAIVGIIMHEAILITSLSGYIGLIIGVSILKIIEPSLKKFFILNPMVSTSMIIGATITLILSGVIAGFLPAKRAASIKPIVALTVH